MTKYSSEIADALEAIAEAGTTLPLKRYPRIVDEATTEKPWKADFTDQRGAGQLDEPSIHTITCAVLPASNGKIEALDKRFRGQTLELSQFRFLLIAASGLGIEPTAGDVVILKGGEWNVIAATAVEPDGTPIIFKAAIRLGL